MQISVPQAIDNLAQPHSQLRRTPSIVKVMMGPAHRVMAAAVYRPQWDMPNGPASRRLKSLEDQSDPRVSVSKGSFFHERALGVVAITDVWQRQVRRLQELGMVLGSLTAKTIQSMECCNQAGVIIDPEPTGVITCRKYSVCPFCRFRKGLELIEEYSAIADDYPYIGEVSIFYPVDEAGMSEQTLGQVRRLVDRICKHNRTWDKDVVVTVPAWSRYTPRWFYRMTIIGFSRKPGSFRPPEELVQTVDWTPVPPVGGTMWRVRPMTTAALRQAVARALEYSPGLLFESLPVGQFAAMTRMAESFRVKKHGWLRKNVS